MYVNINPLIIQCKKYISYERPTIILYLFIYNFFYVYFTIYIMGLWLLFFNNVVSKIRTYIFLSNIQFILPLHSIMIGTYNLDLKLVSFLEFSKYCNGINNIFFVNLTISSSVKIPSHIWNGVYLKYVGQITNMCVLMVWSRGLLIRWYWHLYNLITCSYIWDKVTFSLWIWYFFSH